MTCGTRGDVELFIQQPSVITGSPPATGPITVRPHAFMPVIDDTGNSRLKFELC
jgi:hypothetical protein